MGIVIMDKGTTENAEKRLPLAIRDSKNRLLRL